MHLDESLCTYCGARLRPFDSKYGAIWDKHRHSWGFCTDYCYTKALRPYLPPEFEFSHGPSAFAEYERQETRYEGSYTDWEQWRRGWLRRAENDLTRDLTHKIETQRAQEQERHLQYEQRMWDNAKRIVDAEERVRLAQEEEMRTQREFEESVKPRPIPEQARYEHAFVIGPSGSGKTTILERIILDDLAKPDPPAIVVIDPKGLMIERIARLDLFNPHTGRLRDRIVIVNPADDPPPALNIFDPAFLWNRMWSERVRQQVATQIIGTFGYIFSASGFRLTAKQQIDFSYIVRLLFQIPNATIHTLLDILDDPAKNLDAFSFKVFVARLDPISQRFFRNEFFAEFKESKAQIKARLYMVLTHPSLLASLSVPERKVDLIECLKERKIVLVNTGMTTLGHEASSLIGRYFIAATLNAAFARSLLAKDWPFASLVIDEFQEFADDIKTSQMLRLAREYNLGVTLATQNLHTPPFNDALRNDISTNTSIKYASSPEGVDLSYLARDLRCEQDWLRTQTKTATEARFACFVRGHMEHPMALTFPFGAIQNEPRMSDEDFEKLLELNRGKIAVAVDESPAPEEPAPIKRTPRSSPGASTEDW